MPFSREAIRWGFAKESSRLTAEAAPTTWVSVDKGSELEQKLEHIEDNGMRGVKAAHSPHAGVKVVDGKAGNPLRVRDISYFLNMILGDPATVEQSVVTVSLGVNDAIDFTEDGGTELTATLAAGSYPIGASSATAGSFCAAVKTALDAAGAGTYTVAYDTATRKFTITKDTGVFVILWNTGTNKLICAAALLGYTTAADTASAISATSDVAVSNRAFKHSFSLPSGIQPPTYTVFVDRGISVKKYNGVASRKFSLKATQNGLIMHESDLLGLDEAEGSIGSPSYVGEGSPLGFMHATVKIGGVASTDVKEWTLSFDSGAFAKRVMSGSQVAADVLAPNQLKVEGSILIYFEDETERAKFLANTSNTLQFLIEGSTIAGSVKETFDAQLAKIHYKAYPYGEADNMFAAQANFEAAYDEDTGEFLSVDLINKLSSI